MANRLGEYKGLIVKMIKILILSPPVMFSGMSVYFSL